MTGWLYGAYVFRDTQDTPVHHYNALTGLHATRQTLEVQLTIFR